MVTAHAHAGQAVGEHTPSLAAAYPGLVYERADDPERLRRPRPGLLCPPARRVPTDRPGPAGPGRRHRRPGRRLPPPGPRPLPAWYGEAHAAPGLLAEAVFGLPELFRADLAGATLIAAAGCYPTAAGLALAPLLRAGLVEAERDHRRCRLGRLGRRPAPKDALHFGTVDEDFVAYGLLTHRHTPEMEQILGAQVLFTPHLAPMVRGILATCYARPAPAPGALPPADVMAVLHAAYDDEPFVVVTDAPPSTKATAGSNCAHVTARVDPRTGWVLSLCALDNLVKGASGQAIQCANAALGLPETTGLPAGRGCTRERHRRRGVRGRRGVGAVSRPAVCPMWPSWPRPTVGRSRPPVSSPPTWRRPRRCGSAGPTWPPPAARPPA